MMDEVEAVVEQIALWCIHNYMPLPMRYSDLPKWIKTLKKSRDVLKPTKVPDSIIGTVFTWNLDGQQQYMKPYSNENSPLASSVFKYKTIGDGDQTSRSDIVAADTLIEDIESGFLQELKDEAILAKLALLDF
jgi:hypothetical protein